MDVNCMKIYILIYLSGHNRSRFCFQAVRVVPSGFGGAFPAVCRRSWTFWVVCVCVLLFVQRLADSLMKGKKNFVSDKCNSNT